jgi:phosphoribosylformylglycinamidine cyclo-ligase
VQVISGIAAGCELAGCALIGGETAEMPDMYAPGEYDLAGFCVGAVEKSALIDGTRIEAGDAIVGIESSGPHSNGYSLIRKILSVAGADLADRVGGVSLADALMAPTRIYVKPILALMREVPVKGMAHITGGGLTENVIRVVPDALGLSIDAGAWTLPPVFEWLQQAGNVERPEMWRTFNCGIGYTVIVGRAELAAAKRAMDGLGLRHWEIGAIEQPRGSGRVRIG